MEAQHKKSNFLTLQYALASVATLVTVGAASNALQGAIGLWSSDISTSGVYTTYAQHTFVSIVYSATMALVAAVAAFFLYRSVGRAVSRRLDYLHTRPYVLITNGMIAVSGAMALVYASKLVALLIASLLFIGTPINVGDLYLYEFLPLLFTTALSAGVAWCLYSIGKGKNKSGVLTMLLLIAATVVFVSAIIAVPIRSHQAPESKRGTTSTSDVYDSFYNTYW